MNEIMNIDGIKCYEKDGVAYLDLEAVARGLGFTKRADSGNEVVHWTRVRKYLSDFGVVQKCTTGDFIPESIFYRLAMKAKNSVAEAFMLKVANILTTMHGNRSTASCLSTQSISGLVNVRYDNDKITVSARELHGFLEVGSEFSHWFKRMCEYGFTEGQDFSSFLTESTGGRPAQDAQLTIDMAKEICMLQRNEKGKQARQYFIQLERDWNSPEKVMARALQIANQQIHFLKSENAQQKQLIAEYTPKASYYDLVLQTTDAVSTSQIAKDYGKSAQWLNALLHEYGIQYNQGGVWLLYQKYAEQGYTRSRTHIYTDSEGEQHSRLHTYWTQKGRLFIYDLLKSKGIIPLIDLKNSKKETG